MKSIEITYEIHESFPHTLNSDNAAVQAIRYILFKIYFLMVTLKKLLTFDIKTKDIIKKEIITKPDNQTTIKSQILSKKDSYRILEELTKDGVFTKGEHLNIPFFIKKVTKITQNSPKSNSTQVVFKQPYFTTTILRITPWK